MSSTVSRVALVGALVLAALTTLASAVRAEQKALSADLKAASEVPPAKSNGSGKLTGTYDTSGKTLTWTIEYSGLTGAPVAAHFHGPAMPGANAGIAVPLTGSFASPMKGSAVLTDAQAAELLAGKWYVNIHTPANAAGEIRGQVTAAK